MFVLGLSGLEMWGLSLGVDGLALRLREYRVQRLGTGYQGSELLFLGSGREI